ncbi:hypothetical protein IQ260_18885 [Leptolyngbya cf. ectocarpi LEGE 11479]|uniref:Uncharacterized protein n=1 Tax=Leptolyngbya cf. ectocarpi LEGE 11479 TaxID=1828722 RepID=A0A928ZWG6_LEPEC|nr:hypothetical protein [Leptolyngbya ectocarpi]MBE9068716.1 hypothetical protein [Leptolyngbya cf. ectocarpi LEGE 11479]
MTQANHEGLTLANIKQGWEAGYYTPRGYLYHLILAYQASGSALRIESVAAFCRDWNISRSRFYKAKAALVRDGLLEEKIIGAVGLTAIPVNVARSETADFNSDPEELDQGPSMPALGELIADTLDAQPEQPTSNSDWATWYDEARRRGLVLASRRQGDTTLVCLVDEQWVPFEQLRSQSWEELEAQLQPMVLDAVAEATELTPEQQKILSAMSRLTGG